MAEKTQGALGGGATRADTTEPCGRLGGQVLEQSKQGCAGNATPEAPPDLSRLRASNCETPHILPFGTPGKSSAEGLRITAPLKTAYDPNGSPATFTLRKFSDEVYLSH